MQVNFPITVDSAIELRVLSQQDAPQFHALLTANLDHLRPWFDFARSQQPYEDSLAFIRRTQQRYSDGLGFWAGVWHHESLAGAVGFTEFDRGNSATELSYWLSKDFTGRGIATGACAAMIEWAFRHRKLHRITLRMAAENTRSIALAERLGFRREGVLKEAERCEGGFRDVVIYGLLAGQ